MTQDDFNRLAYGLLVGASARLSLVDLGEMTAPEAVAELVDPFTRLSPGIFCSCVCRDVARAERTHPHVPRRRPLRRAA